MNTSKQDIVHRILSAIAQRKQCSILELNPPLQTVVDVDSLVQFANADNVKSIEFTYLGYSVTLREHGQVEVNSRFEV